MPRKLLEMASGLSAEDPGQRISLLVRRLLIEVKRDLPLHLVHRSRGVHRHGHIEAAEVERAASALCDMPADQGSALTFGRRTQHDAGAKSLTTAALEIGAPKVPVICHGTLHAMGHRHSQGGM